MLQEQLSSTGQGADSHLVGPGCMRVVVRVPLKPEDDGVGEQPVPVPGVLCCRPLKAAQKWHSVNSPSILSNNALAKSSDTGANLLTPSIKV